MADRTKIECPTCRRGFAPNGIKNHAKKCGQVCGVADCDSPTKTAGFCGRHYQRKRKYGDPTVVHRYRDDSERPECSVDECDDGVKSNGMCQLHYARFWRTGTTELPERPDTCSVEDCEREYFSSGYCNMHHARVRVHGSTDDPRPSAQQRLHSFFRHGRAWECWDWTGASNPQGYGRCSRALSVSGTGQAHRAVFEHFEGAVPEGKELDHVCRNRACVNPNHLEPVTRAENVRRAQKGAVHYF